MRPYPDISVTDTDRDQVEGPETITNFSLGT